MEYLFVVTGAAGFFAMLFVAKKAQYEMESLRKARGWRPMSDF